MEEEFLETRQICRLCLWEEKLQPVSDSEFASDFDNFNFIEAVLNYELPKNVCEKCLGELNRIASFIKKCKESYDILTQRLQEDEEAERESVMQRALLDHIGYIKEDETELNLKEENTISSWERASNCSSNSNAETDKDLIVSNKACDTSTEQYVDFVIESGAPIEQSIADDVKNCGKTKSMKVCGRCGKAVTKIVDHYKLSETCRPKRIKCEIKSTKVCGRCGESVSKMVDHYKVSKACRLVRVRCKICYQYYPSKFLWRQHMREHHPEQISRNSYMCHLCSKTFSSPFNLRRHVLVHEHGKRFVCDVCGKRYTSESTLKQHSNLHKGITPYCCCYCGKMFSSRANYIQHENIHRKSTDAMLPDPLQNCTCTICGQQFVQMRFLKLHMRVHDDNYVYKCKKCKEGFESAALFRQHSAVHASERRYPCSLCSKRFTTRNLLTRHERVHTGERPFSCTICSKAFSQDNHLKRHTRLQHQYNGQKPFKCKICEQRFAENGNLRAHMKIHTGEKSYSCHVCKRTFVVSSKRRKHVKMVHGEDEVKNIIDG